MARKLDIIDLGRIEYGQALDLQARSVTLRQEEEIPDTLYLLEHPPVITRGKRAGDEDIIASAEFLAQQGVTVFDVERGGEATYHGPGQLVGYCIFNLYDKQRQLKRFVENLEEVFIGYLRSGFQIDADRVPKHRGVWVGNEKITAIGISIHGGVTKHGFAFNVSTDLSHFDWIIPCGIRDKGVASIRSLRGEAPPMEEVKRAIGHRFEEVFDYEATFRALAETPMGTIGG